MKLEITFEELLELLLVVNCELNSVLSFIAKSELDVTYFKNESKVLESLKVKLTQLLDNI